MTKQGMISGIVPKRNRKRLLLYVVMGVVAVAVGAGVWWYIAHRPHVLTEHQKEVQISILAQERFLRDNQDRPADVRAITLANLASSYAEIGECGKAREALTQARQLMPTELQDSTERTDRQVRAACP